LITRIYITVLGMFLSIGAFCQVQPINENKLGIKTSMNFSSLTGNELKNPRVKFGYTAGAYFINKMNKKWDLYSEIVGNFKGSKFKNGDTGYSQIALFYVDAVVSPMYKLNDNKNAVSFGPYASYLGLSSLYIGPKKKAELNDIGLAPWDAGIAAYYYIFEKNVSFQFGAKFGITNANKDVNFETYFPVTGTGKSIRNLSFELGMLF
jgi:hypothetical protein